MVDLHTIESWRKAPRLTSFAEFFERTASGRAGAPDLAQPAPDMSLLDFDLYCTVFAHAYRQMWTPFNAHWLASIPYRLEEQCRLGPAMLSFALRAWARSAAPATVYLGGGAGLPRTDAGEIRRRAHQDAELQPDRRQSCSLPRNRGSEHAHFFHGPFFELDDARYQIDDDLQSFRNGFDLISKTPSRCYDRDRRSQLDFIAPRLRPGGLLIQVEKLSHKDAHTYHERERQKKIRCSSRFFSAGQISKKKEEVVDTMADCQVDMATTMAALQANFRYSVVTWNSGNFYTFVSSNSREAVQAFVSLLVKPAIPVEFCYETLPLIIVIP
nr:class I SAM-dependent methyltransferase [Rhizobium sp. ACO-34A]